MTNKIKDVNNDLKKVDSNLNEYKDQKNFILEVINQNKNDEAVIEAISRKGTSLGINIE